MALMVMPVVSLPVFMIAGFELVERDDYFSARWPLVVAAIPFAVGAHLVANPTSVGRARGQKLTARLLLKHSLCGVVGAVLGGGAGVLATLAITKLVMALAPSDPSAGSVGIMIIGLLPARLLGGAMIAVSWSVKRERKRTPVVPPSL